MRLTAEMFDQIVAGLKSDAGGKKDKRLEPRVGVAGEADLVTVSDDGRRVTAVVRVRDISVNGLGLSCEHKLGSGQLFVLQLPTKSRQTLGLVCATAYCRRVGEERYIVGARIKQLMRPDAVRKPEPVAVAAAVHAPPVEVATLQIAPIVELPSAVLSGPEADIARIAKAILF